MTSRSREFAQIPARIQYLFAVEATTAWVPNADTKFNSIVPETTFGSQYTVRNPAIPQAMIMRDMGRFLTLVNSKGQHTATLRLVQTVSGPGTEGVPDNWDTIGQYYVSVWAADPLSVFYPTVVRTG
jgi:hypothetical protein